MGSEGLLRDREKAGSAVPSDSNIPVARPWLGEAEAEAARRAILSGWVTQGPEVQAFEQEFAAFVGAPCACAVSSGTAALFLALRAVGVGPGSEVVTVSHSFIATANCIRHLGATPIFVDIEPHTSNMDPGKLESAIGPATRAILVVHQLGMPCDLAAILDVARRKGLPVVEDAACAAGSEILWQGRWERIGRPHGSLACFSFHPRKLLTTGDGGMITTANPSWLEKLRLWRQHGMSIPDTVRHTAARVTNEAYPEIGYNFRMTDIQAAVGREQLKKLPELVSHRREQVERYRELLSDLPSLRFPSQPSWARSNWQSLCLRLPPGMSQSSVMQDLLDLGISTRRGVMCSHREPAYPSGTWGCRPGGCDCGPEGCRRLRASVEAQDQTLIVPLFHELTEAQQVRVAEALSLVLRRQGVASSKLHRSSKD